MSPVVIGGFAAIDAALIAQLGYALRDYRRRSRRRRDRRIRRRLPSDQHDRPALR